MMSRITMLGIALMGMLGAPAQAQAEDDFGRPGAYVGLGFALGFENFDMPFAVDVNTPVGFDFWVVYRVIPNLAVEVEVEYLNAFDFQDGPVLFEVDQLAATPVRLEPLDAP